jgi:hypothetical protein
VQQKTNQKQLLITLKKKTKKKKPQSPSQRFLEYSFSSNRI